MNTNEYFRAARNLVNPRLLVKIVVAILGVGSGGSLIADWFARLGIGVIILVERPGEVIQEHNITRHALGYSWLNKSKVEGVAARIIDINPLCEVRIAEADVVQDFGKVEDAVKDAGHLACCLDNEPGKHIANELSTNLGISTTFGAVFENGVGGEVFLHRPGDACYACFTRYAQRGVPIPEKKSKPVDYLTLDTLEPDVIPALGIDIAPIALAQARIALLEMTRVLSPERALHGNYLLLGNRAYEGLFPRMFHSEIHTIERNPDCLVCGRTTDSDGNISLEAARIRESLGIASS